MHETDRGPTPHPPTKGRGFNTSWFKRCRAVRKVKVDEHLEISVPWQTLLLSRGIRQSQSSGIPTLLVSHGLGSAEAGVVKESTGELKHEKDQKDNNIECLSVWKAKCIS